MNERDDGPAEPTKCRWVAYAGQNHLIPTELLRPELRTVTALCGLMGIPPDAVWGNSLPKCAWCAYVELDGEVAVHGLDGSCGLAPHAGHAQVVGVTGSPGVGKSTSTSALVAELRKAEKRVGILAVDPSSPFSGGALLGDRVRMQDHALDGEVYIRSMASRGHLGGLAWTTPQAVRVLDAAGCDVILIETVGVGQSEVEIAGLADTTLVLLAPGMGDGIQAAKAGILEIGDLYVINKSDRDGADQVRRDLRSMLALAERPEGSWRPPIVKTVASRSEGLDEVVAEIDKHRAWLEESGELERRRTRRARDEIEAIAVTALRARWGDVHGRSELDDLAAAVVAGTSDPYTAADTLLEAFAE